MADDAVADDAVAEDAAAPASSDASADTAATTADAATPPSASTEGLETAPARSRAATVLIAVGVVLALAANAAMLVLLSGWRAEREQLVERLESAGTEQSAAVARAQEQAAERELLSSQITAAQAKVASLDPTEQDALAELGALRDALIALRECSDARADLIDDLWVSSASAQASQERRVDAACESALAAYREATR